jgi:hypothetical protein
MVVMDDKVAYFIALSFQRLSFLKPFLTFNLHIFSFIYIQNVGRNN